MTVTRFLGLALRATIFVAPRDCGLTLAELVEAGERHGFKEGELRDAFRSQARDVRRGGRLWPSSTLATRIVDFNDIWESDPRNIEAFQFVLDTLHELAREHGRANAKIDRAVLVAQGEAQGVTAHDLEVAISAYVVADEVAEDADGLLTRVGGYAAPQQQSQRLTQAPKDQLAVIETIRDIVARRTGDQHNSAEPLRAFADFLSGTSMAQYRVWWERTASESRLVDPTTLPTATVVLAAALAEGALTLVASDVNKTGETMQGKVLQRDPREWHFAELVRMAKGGSRPLLSQALAARCILLNDERQRIHAGRFLSAGTPAANIDIRPEEARDARETLERLVRAILDWFANAP